MVNVFPFNSNKLCSNPATKSEKIKQNMTRFCPDQIVTLSWQLEQLISTKTDISFEVNLFCWDNAISSPCCITVVVLSKSIHNRPFRDRLFEKILDFEISIHTGFKNSFIGTIDNRNEAAMIRQNYKFRSQINDSGTFAIQNGFSA